MHVFLHMMMSLNELCDVSKKHEIMVRTETETDQMSRKIKINNKCVLSKALVRFEFKHGGFSKEIKVYVLR